MCLLAIINATNIPQGNVGKPICSVISFFKTNCHVLRPSVGWSYIAKSGQCNRVFPPHRSVVSSNFFTNKDDCDNSCLGQQTLANVNLDPYYECLRPPILSTNPGIKCFAASEGYTFKKDTNKCEPITFSCADNISYNLFRDKATCNEFCLPLSINLCKLV